MHRWGSSVDRVQRDFLGPRCPSSCKDFSQPSPFCSSWCQHHPGAFGRAESSGLSPAVPLAATGLILLFCASELLLQLQDAAGLCQRRQYRALHLPSVLPVLPHKQTQLLTI